MRVRHRFQRSESFRGNNEEGFRRVEEVADRLRKVRAIDIRNKAERHPAVAVMFQRLVRHHRAEIGSADADVDDGADALSGGSFPFTTADAVS